MAEENYLVAAASEDGRLIREHFGRAHTFYIYRMYEEGYDLVGTREVHPPCQGGYHFEDGLREALEKFTDCKYILVSRIGPGAENMAQQLGITAVELPGDLEEGLEKLRTYEQIQKLFE